MKRFVLLVLTNIILSFPQAQTIYPEIGKPCPDFELHNIKYYRKKQASLEDFSGKWLVLDFWNKYCGACIASFPRVSALQKEFADKAQFMLVGIEDKEEQIEPMYARFRKEENLIMPCAFDSLLANRFDIYTAPYILIIDEAGIVRGITTSLLPDNMRELLAGQFPKLAKAYRVHEAEIDTRIPYNYKQPFLVNNNGGRDTSYLFRSIFSNFDASKQHSFIPPTITWNTVPGRFQVLGVSLVHLYNYAYYGTYGVDSGNWDKPVLETRDSTLFQSSNNKTLFCYSLTTPPDKASKNRIESMMQNDLENYFGYAVTLEERSFPYWRLISTNKSKTQLQTKGGPKIYRVIIPKVEFIAQNWPMSNLVSLLRVNSGKNILDETGITSNIDIHLNCILTDLNHLREGLQQNGLDLIPSTRLWKVLVIHDKP
ncbi:MAG TPA: redoxin domain-containing protein [Puia sp.]|jgi:thiol-disulfide isomerase/thioredoxin